MKHTYGKMDYRNKLRGILSFIFFTFLTSVSGQVDPNSNKISLGYPVYSQYLQNGLVINPAYTGSRGALCSFLSYRRQWMGIDGAPQLYSGSLHSPMRNDKVALGLLFQYMDYGYTKSGAFYGSYAYHIRIGKGRLSFGMKAGVDLSNTNYNALNLTTRPDNAFPETYEPYILPNVGAGIYYFNEKLFAGLAVPKFLNYNKSPAGSVIAYHSFNEYDFVFSGGGLITFSQFFKFKPSVLVSYSLDETSGLMQLDLNGNFILADLVWLGGSYRTTEQVAVGILQFQIRQKLMLGFSYDYPVGSTNSYAKPSSEFVLRYELGSRVSTANPRYF